LPTQSVSGGQTTVTVQQTAQRAIMTWQQFNVGRNTTLYFDQSAGNSSNGNSWVALNRIDASGSPSQILGSIKAEGTVLLINPNGIIFTGTSQIDVHTLIASSLDLNTISNSSGTNYGAFSSTYSCTSVCGGDYVKVGTTASGNALLAPNNEANANTQFLENGLYTSTTSSSMGSILVLSAGTSTGSFASTGSYGGLSAGPNAGVVVQAGAIITTADNVSGFDNGGYVALIGPQVSNAGTITTSAGQIILAAGASVFLTEPASGSSTTSFSVANLLRMVNSNASLIYDPGTVSGGAYAINTADGILVSTRGNITLVGDTVEQLGVAEATTSITRAGSITLTATGTPTTSNPDLGLALFGSSSVTTILPEENGETIPTSSVSSFVAPTVAITTTNMDMQSGSLILAPGATMTVDSLAGTTSSGSTAGRVLLEDGSAIDLAGLVATRSLTDYLYTFKVTANDVADTPLARSLIGQTVTIDLRLSGTRADGETWVGSPLFASTGASYLAKVSQSIDQLLTKGGSLTIGGSAAFNDVITAKGATVDVSGGLIAFTGGTVATTRLLGSDGRSYDIGSADPTITYQGLASGFTVDHARAGVTEIYAGLLRASGSYVEAGYVDGVSAGGVSVIAVNPVLEGTIDAAIVIGSRQAALAQVATGTSGTQTTPDELPTGASLTIKLVTSDGSATTTAVVLDSTASDVLGSDFTLGSALTLPKNTAGLSTITYGTDALTASELGSIKITGAADLSMAEGANLAVRSGGSITLTNVSTIDGTLTAHAGSISLSGYAYNYTTQPLVSALIIGSDAMLDVSGLWVNDSGLYGDALQGSAWINGGSISLVTYKDSGSVSSVTNADGSTTYTAKDKTQSIVLAKGSVIDVSSGGYVTTSGKLKTGSNGLPAGNGGNLTLTTYTDSSDGAWAGDTYGANVPLGTTVPLAPTAATAATVVFDGTIYAAGLNKGGTLTLQVPAIAIDGSATTITTNGSTGTLTLPTSFFSQGFSSYKLTSTYGGINLTAGTTLTLQQQNYVLDTTALAATGAKLRDVATLGYAEDGLRQPVNLSLTQTAYYYGSAGDATTTAGVVVGDGASIVADPKASVTLTADRAVTVLGSITAPGGSITLTGTQDVWIGADAVLDVSGVYVPNPLVTAYATGSVLAGGSITIGGTGAIVALTGSVFDIEGASATIEVPTGGSVPGSSKYASEPIWSDGGALTLYGNNLYFGGTIKAAGGAASASGGTLNVGTLVTSTDRNGNKVYYNNGFGTILIAPSGDVTAALAAASAPATASQVSALGLTSGTAYITADTINTAKLDSVSLTGTTIAFAGDVTLKVPDALYLNGNITLLPAGAASLAAATSAVATTVTLDAGYIRWVSGATAVPVAGGGTLNLNASAQIDLAGVVSASYADQVNLVSGGDIRLLQSADPDVAGYTGAGNTTGTTYGALMVADNLSLTAREVYASTNADFLLISLGLAPSTASGTHNTITFASNGLTPYAPLSAGGAILVDAKTIVQGGALYAPLGTIRLGYSSTDSLPSAYTKISAITTQSVTLAPGSLTSVSAAGLDIPYGTTTDGATWTAWSTLTAPPSKLIVLAGNSVTTQAGAVIDESGGGDVYATEFVAGTGGSRNVLTTTTQTVYALVPSYEAKVAAYDPTFGTTVANGSAVTLTGGNGIAAGTYVLLPAQYATLPGSYRVVVVKTNTGNTAATSTVTADGSIYMTGVMTNAITGAKSSSTALFEIQSNAVWSKYSEIDITYGNSYFAALAATNGTAVPRLAQDAGQLIIAAATSLTLGATNIFTAASGGRGGEVDITGSNLLVVASDLAASYAASGTYSGYIVLDAD
ncbi:MAG: filamentous hemagglutinin N-terminal domain-containing protein, partial [Mycobacterium sp.]|nr:filamentous hemagglutinin N-terminal domain-containing protein [Mycobacterium sp.]